MAKTTVQKASESQKTARAFQGVVTSAAMNKTITVKIDRVRQHAKYGKSYVVSRKYKVHDEENRYKEGDTVTFVQCRPLSKDKRWRVLYQ